MGKSHGLEPQHVDKSTWYYEFPRHLLIVHEVRDKAGGYIQTEQFKLPWRLIEKSRAKRPKPRKAVR